MDDNSKKREPEKDNGGEWVQLGEEFFKIPPLNFRALRELESTLRGINKIEAVPTQEQVDGMMKVAYAALKRNYPSVTEEQFVDMLDLGNVRVLLKAIMGLPGVKELPAGKS